MILEDETFRKFGYCARDLGNGSHKPVITKCDSCGIIKIKERRRAELLCQACARKGHATKEETKQKIRNTLTGIPHTEERNRNNSRSHRGSFFTKKDRRTKRELEKNTVREEKNIQSKGSFEIIECEICGKNFGAARDQIKRGWGRFCSQKCANIGQSGEKSPNWQGGKSFEPYCEKWNEDFREYIRVKFSKKCFLCGMSEEENCRKLSVHHVNYQKSCGCAETEEEKKRDNAVCQFVPLCLNCHLKTNNNRKYWEKFIKTKMKNKLDGWYI